MDARKIFEIQKSLHVKILVLKNEIEELKRKNENLIKEQKGKYDLYYDMNQKNNSLRKKNKELNERIGNLERRMNKPQSNRPSKDSETSEDLAKKINAKIAQELEHYAGGVYEREMRTRNLKIENAELHREVKNLRSENKKKATEMSQQLQKRAKRGPGEARKMKRSASQMQERFVVEFGEEAKRILAKMEKKLAWFKDKVEKSKNYENLYNQSIKMILKMNKHVKMFKMTLGGKSANSMSLSKYPGSVT